MTNSTQLVLFKLEEETFGVDIDTVREIVRADAATVLPKTYDWVDGVIVLKGKVIPLIDLKRYLGFPGDLGEEKRTVVMEINQSLIGLNVDSVEGIAKVTPECLEACQQIAADNYIEGIAKIEHKKIVVLNVIKLLAMDQPEDIKSLLEEIKQKAG